MNVLTYCVNVYRDNVLVHNTLLQVQFTLQTMDVNAIVDSARAFFNANVDPVLKARIEEFYNGLIKRESNMRSFIYKYKSEFPEVFSLFMMWSSIEFSRVHNDVWTSARQLLKDNGEIYFGFLSEPLRTVSLHDTLSAEEEPTQGDVLPAEATPMQGDALPWAVESMQGDALPAEAAPMRGDALQGGAGAMNMLEAVWASNLTYETKVFCARLLGMGS